MQGHEIQEDARTAQDRLGREARNENSVEMEQNNLEGVHTPLHRSILEVIHQEEKEGLPYLKSCDRSKLRAKAAIVNETVKDTLTNDITEMKSMLYAAVYVVSQRMGMIKETRVRKKRRRLREALKTAVKI